MLKNKKLFLGIIVGILFSGVGVYAATTYMASDVTYKDKTVEVALDELYTKTVQNTEKSSFGV